ncbi:hypothetical protein ACQ4PT_046499 [Festuca glaucescens]
MTLGRRAPRVSRATQPPPANSGVADGTYDGYTRGMSDLPPVIPNKEDRPIIRPAGATHWMDIPVTRKGRRPSSVLTCLLKRHHPGIVDYFGAKVLATEWEHYHTVKDSDDHSVADKIEDAFWLRYRCEDGYSYEAKKHLAGQYYLDRDEYLAQRQDWLGKEAWIAAVDEWCSPKWIAKSKKGRANCVSSNYKPHKGGSLSMTNISQKLSEQTGQKVNQIQAWVHTHRGTDENNPLTLNTPEATKCLIRYTQRAKQFNGEGYDLNKDVVCSKALYACSKGKPHGRWAMFNGMVNDTDVIAKAKADGSSSAAALKRRRVEELEEELRMKDEKTQKSEAYTNSLFTWGASMYEHCQGTHKLLEILATNQGVPINEILPPPVPPPARPPSPAHAPPSTIHNLETNEELPHFCAEELAESPSVHEHVGTSNVFSQDVNPVPAAAEEGMFGGFFTGTDQLNLSLVQSEALS